MTDSSTVMASIAVCVSIEAIPRPQHNQRAKHHGHVGDVEDAGAHWPDANIYEVDHASVENSIEQVRRAAGGKQRHTQERRPWPSAADGGGHEGTEEERVPHAKDGKTSSRWPLCAKTQERAGVLRILEPQGVGKE